MNTFVAGPKFRTVVNGPDVCVGEVFPVYEVGGGWVRVIALVTSPEAQQQLVDALMIAEAQRQPSCAAA